MSSSTDKDYNPKEPLTTTSGKTSTASTETTTKTTTSGKTSTASTETTTKTTTTTTVSGTTTIASAAGGALLGTAFGPLGSIIGALSGATVTVVASTCGSRKKAAKAGGGEDHE